MLILSRAENMEKSSILKSTSNHNTIKHDIKENFFHSIQKEADDIHLLKYDQKLCRVKTFFDAILVLFA